MKSKTESVKITSLNPESAKRLLANNPNNRPLRDKRINKLAKAILENRWQFNGASIVVDNRGVMLDGQHRCHAVIRAKKPIKTVLVTGVKPQVFDTIDQGAKRSGADIFHLCGVSNASIVAASLTIVYQNRHGVPEGTESSGSTPDMDERTALFDELPHYEDIVRDALRYKHNFSGILSASMISGLYFLFQEKSKEAAHRFLATFATGEGEAGNPAIVVRRIFEKLAQQDYRIGRQTRAAYVKLAWNAFVAGKAVSNIELPETLDIPISRVTNRHWIDSVQGVAA